MTILASLEHQPRGVIAALAAFWTQFVDLVRGIAGWREQGRRLNCYEAQLVHALFGGGLNNDPAFIALPLQEKRAWRRRLARNLNEVRRLKVIRHRVQTLKGHGYRRKPAGTVLRRYERRIASRAVRRLGCARLAFVAATREVLAGAPP